MNDNLWSWLLLLLRWLHIIVGITWIGTSIFFMWLDRTFVKNENSDRDGHVGELWMVHGGGFYKVEKMLMGPTKVPALLHWFKWESYWTWVSGMALLVLIFYSGEGTFLLDDTVSDITFAAALGLCIFTILGSWFFYDQLWERNFIQDSPKLGHLLTLIWFVGMTYLLCHQLSGRAAYIHIGAMIGTWMAGNVFMRIIPRQVKMVEASNTGGDINPKWAVNAKNRSTHNTYFTLPLIFIMLSNHFPNTYGNDQSWLVLILITVIGALIRHSFLIRLTNAGRAKVLVGLSLVFIILGTLLTSESEMEEISETVEIQKKIEQVVEIEVTDTEEPPVAIEQDITYGSITGSVFYKGKPYVGKALKLPSACAKQHSGKVISDEVIVKNGKLANVLIRITTGLPKKNYGDIPTEEVVLDQKGCIYKPRLIAARVGQPITFVNSDPVFHNVKLLAKKNPRFNLAMPKKNQRKTKVFKKAELLLRTKCNVHPWMGANIAIMDHPFFSVTRGPGTYRLENIPTGKYTLELWHEVLGTLTHELEVKGEENIALDFTFTRE
jgi:uncharacterized membrane protein/plastocyanin